MGNGHHGARVFFQELLQPAHGFGIQVVGRFVEQQHIRLGHQQTAQRHTAALTTGQFGDVGIPGRQTQGIGGHFHLTFHIVTASGFDKGFQLALFFRQRIKIGIRLGVRGVHRVQRGTGIHQFAQAVFDVTFHIFIRIQLGFLRQVTDFQIRLRAGFANDVSIQTRHDLQQGGLTGAVQTQYADLGPREER